MANSSTNYKLLWEFVYEKTKVILTNQKKKAKSIELVKVEDASNQDDVLEDVINNLVVTEHEQILSSIVNNLTE